MTSLPVAKSDKLSAMATDQSAGNAGPAVTRSAGVMNDGSKEIVTIMRVARMESHAVDPAFTASLNDAPILTPAVSERFDERRAESERLASRNGVRSFTHAQRHV